MLPHYLKMRMTAALRTKPALRAAQNVGQHRSICQSRIHYMDESKRQRIVSGCGSCN